MPPVLQWILVIAGAAVLIWNFVHWLKGRKSKPGEAVGGKLSFTEPVDQTKKEK